MHNLYLSLGSNIGDRHALIQQALQMLDERVGSVYRVSSFIETEPWGFESERKFLNAACLVHTMMSPQDCLEETKRIEQLLGRTQKSTDGQYHDRPIDIDLLMYDDEHITQEDLVLPHPHMYERDFVMIPLREILQ